MNNNDSNNKNDKNNNNHKSHSFFPIPISLNIRFRVLLACLILLLFLSPYLEGQYFFQWAFNLLIFLIFISVIFTVQVALKHMLLFIVIAILSFSFNLLGTLYSSHVYHFIGNVFFVIFFAAAIVSFTKEIMTGEKNRPR